MKASELLKGLTPATRRQERLRQRLKVVFAAIPDNQRGVKIYQQKQKEGLMRCKSLQVSILNVSKVNTTKCKED